jgi:dolichol-phosphate mannosyltransferase
MGVLVVTPTYQEGANIEEFLRRVRAALPDADVLVVDDNSPDGTAKIAASMDDELGHIDVMERPGKAGLGSAYRDGFARALQSGYDVIVQMDADLSHDPADLPRLISALSSDVAMVVGSRYVPGGSIPNWPAHRRMLSRYGNRYASMMLNLGVTDVTSGYRAYRADVVKNIDLASTKATGYGFMIEVAHRVGQRGGRIVEVPIVFTDRVRGTSKMSGRIIAEAMALVTRVGVRDRLHRSRPQSPAPATSDTNLG